MLQTMLAEMLQQVARRLRSRVLETQRETAFKPHPPMPGLRPSESRAFFLGGTWPDAFLHSLMA